MSIRKKFVKMKCWPLPVVLTVPTFCVKGQLKILEFGYFVLIWQESHKKQETV